MRVSEALELFEQSASSFKAEIERLSIKEIYELVKDLKLFKNPELFKISYYILLKRSLDFLEDLENCEKTAKEGGFDILRRHVDEQTGFRVDSETLPSVAVRKMINEITNWSQ
jgi:hypothetical protein